MGLDVPTSNPQAKPILGKPPVANQAVNPQADPVPDIAQVSNQTTNPTIPTLDHGPIVDAIWQVPTINSGDV